jgi:hypothetical protein
LLGAKPEQRRSPSRTLLRSLLVIRARKLLAIAGSVLAPPQLFQEQARLALHDRALRSCIFRLGRNPLPMQRLETSALDPEPDHLLVQGAPWNLEALQRSRDIAAGLQQTLPDRGALEVPDLARQ